MKVVFRVASGTEATNKGNFFETFSELVSERKSCTLGLFKKFDSKKGILEEPGLEPADLWATKYESGPGALDLSATSLCWRNFYVYSS